ncbi:MAG TPA: BatA domain-containing protein [Tepidisphaeraceae bacterium]|nr:BatA domain-containing protein [Tepidisphaeraceae bacterium]
MNGFSFLFTPALWALPLAGIPILLHLLYRRKSPIVQFSTLRFIKSSIQRTAARKKVQRWLLLACRALLLALLIWALSQPVSRPLAGTLGASDSSLAAAIVVDTSYSMELTGQQVTLLQRANDAVQDLLRNELRDAQVAILASQPSSVPGHFEPAADFRGDRWAPLSATPSPVPLVDRVATAQDLLSQSGASRKWLIIITDAQAKEFPRPISPPGGVQTMLIDLHPPDAYAAGITRVFTTPSQPRLGLNALAAVDVTGRAGDSREITLSAAPADRPENAIPFPPLPMAHIRANGTAELSSPLPAVTAPWVVITAHLSGDEPLAWAQSRQQLVHISPKQVAAVVEIGPGNDVADRMIRLALDPSEGQLADWPVSVEPGQPDGREALIAAVLTDWPDEQTCRQLVDFADRGGDLVIFVQPGLERAWDSLSPQRQQALEALLPSAPQTLAPNSGPFRAAVVTPSDPIFTGLGDDAQTAAQRLVVTRLVPFTGDDMDVTQLLKAMPSDPDSPAAPVGLLWRRSIGDGAVFTWGTVPDITSGNLRVSEIFPPSLINAMLKPPRDQSGLNTIIGNPIQLQATDIPAAAEVDVTAPGRPAVKVDPTLSGDNPHFIFTDTSQPGLYQWTEILHGQPRTIAWTNVEISPDEARLTYLPLAQIAPSSVGAVTGHSLAEIRSKLANSEESEPHWSWAIAAVLLLMCLEAVMGSLPKTWTIRWPRWPRLPMADMVK